MNERIVSIRYEVLNPLTMGKLGTEKIDIIHVVPVFLPVSFSSSYVSAATPHDAAILLVVPEFQPHGGYVVHCRKRRGSAAKNIGGEPDAMKMHDRRNLDFRCVESLLKFKTKAPTQCIPGVLKNCRGRSIGEAGNIPAVRHGCYPTFTPIPDNRCLVDKSVAFSGLDRYPST